MDLIDDKIRNLLKQGDLNLNLGCGKLKMDNCLNCDLYDEDADRKIDAKDLSEFGDETVNAIYANNLFEHFGYEEGRILLKEWNRVLMRGGYLILSLPNMNRIIEVVYDWNTAVWEQKPTNLWDSMMKMIFGWQNGEGQFHKWGYSPEYLSDILKDNGFKINKLYLAYPRRPTPNFTVVAEKIQKEDNENVRNFEANSVC